MRVQLACANNLLSLRVLDAGDGICPSDDTTGLGLIGLRNRVESLGGRFEAGSRPDSGGSLLLELDLGEWT